MNTSETFFTDNEPHEIASAEIINNLGRDVVSRIAKRDSDPEKAFVATSEIEKIIITDAREATGEVGYELSELESMIEANKEANNG